MSSTRNPSKTSESSGQPPPAASAGGLECESCRSAPGIPFCRVDWSFLCFGCASIVHGNNCVVSVPLNPNPNPNFTHPPYHPYPYPHNPFANPSTDPNAAAHLSSEDDDLSPSQIPGKSASRRRLESVMRYREKRKSRRFEKTVRYENRRAYAESRPRLDGKFAGRRDDGGNGEEAETGDAEVGEDSGEEGSAPGFMGMDRVSVRPDGGAELGGLVAAGGELGQHDFVEDVRFQ